MRREVKQKILQLFNTLQEAHGEIRQYLRKGEYVKAREVLADCQNCAILIGNTIEQFENNQKQIIQNLENYCEQLFLLHSDLENLNDIEKKERIEYLEEQTRKNYSEVKDKIKATLRVVFFPYKASMWTSLESIWKAAAEDEECEVKVVVIPYFTLDSREHGLKLNYEGSMFPDYVPITHYSQYHVEQEFPDMIFIHNPYDETNNVTRVPKQYYSYNLKPYTKQLIYSPYGMMGYYSPNAGAFMCCTNAVSIADKILVQSERVKQIYLDYGIREEKLIALGSPKVDAIVNDLKKEIQYPVGWKEKLEGRKVFLLNTHLSYFVKGYLYKKNHPEKSNYAEWYHNEMFNQLLNREGCALIWRPHPLLKATLESRNLFSELEFVKELEKRLEESVNGVLDTNGKYDISFRLSDALITTYSSIIPEYMISGKPIYIYQNRLNLDNCKNSPVDYSNNYYKAQPGEEAKFSNFVQMVINGEDPLYEKRMADVNKAFSNLTGTIGQSVYRVLKDSLSII